MIKRRFYRNDHGDNDDASDSSSSSSDSELEGEAAEQTEAEDDGVPEIKEHREASSGYETEDSSLNEVDADPSGNDGPAINSHSYRTSDAEIVDSLPNTVAEKDLSLADLGYVLKCKSVFKCRLCPKILCLTEKTLMAHLKSKGHARSKKLHDEGRLKFMLNSDGEIEGGEDGETHAERHARILAATQSLTNSTKKNKGRQREKTMSKKKTGEDSNLDTARKSMKSPTKKRHKSEN